MAGDFRVKQNVNELIPKNSNGISSDNIDRFRLLKLVNDLYTAVNTGTVIGIQTNLISNTATLSGQVLSWNGSSVLWAYPTFNGNSFSLCVPNVILIGKSLGTGTSITATILSGVATITHTAHGYAKGDIVVLTGTSGGGTFAGLYVIQSIVDANTYTINTSATGTVTTPKELFWFSGSRSLNPTLISNITRTSTAVYVITFKNSQSDAFFSITSEASSSSAACIFSLSSGSPPTTSGFTANYFNTGGTPEEANQYLQFLLIGII